MNPGALAAPSSAAAILIAAAGLLLGALALLSARRLRPALGILLDLLLAAGLLRLAFLDTWTAIAGAATLVAVRKLVVHALTADVFTLGAARPPRGSPGPRPAAAASRRPAGRPPC